MLNSLAEGIFGELAFERGVEPHHDVGFWDAHVHQFGGDVVFGAGL